MSFKAVPKKTFTRRSRGQDPNDGDAPLPFTPTQARPPPSGNLMSAIGKHATEVDHKIAEMEKKRKRDKYGDRQGKEVLKRYKYAEIPETASAPPSDEGAVLGAGKEGDVFDDMDKEALMEALEVESPLPFSNPNPPARMTTHNEPPYTDPVDKSFKTASNQDSQSSRRNEHAALQGRQIVSQSHRVQQQAPITPLPKTRPQVGGRRPVPQYDDAIPSSPYTAASSSGPSTPKTPIPIPTLRSNGQGREARLAAVKNASVPFPNPPPSKTPKLQQFHRRRGGFVNQPSATANAQPQEDEFADDAFDMLLASTDILDDGAQLSCFDSLY